jgi:hypothetical protein
LAEVIFRCLVWAAVVALSIAFAYGPTEAKAVALMLGTFMVFAWYVRRILSR